MRLVKPQRLEPGAHVGLVAPASAPPDPGAIERSFAVLQKLGFKPVLAPNVRKRWGFLAGKDRDRASDLMRMFLDRKIQAIFCVRGGYGTPRLLPLLDYEAIRSHPKILVGYSDITALHSALLHKAGLVGFHGPMLNSDFIKSKCPTFTRQSLLRTVMRPAPAGDVAQGYGGAPVEVLRSGSATGQLLGGNLTLLCALIGTPYQPCFNGAILFFEDLDEPPYRFDRMLTQLLQARVLQGVRGIAIGVNKGCIDPRAGKLREYRQTMQDVLRERLLPLRVPIVSGLPFGHIRHNTTLPLGVEARLDGDNGRLEILESAVR